MAFTANPEDYTARGKIITPLKDRIGSEIRTHYATTRHQALAITQQEAWTSRKELAVTVPEYVREVVEEVAFQARAERRIDKRSGVSQRMPITVLENVTSNAERRALAHAESPAVASIGDVYAALPAMTGKFELEYEGELRGADQIARELIRAAVANVFVGYFENVDTRSVVDWFDKGGTVQFDETASSATLLSDANRVPGLLDLTRHAGVDHRADAPTRAAAVGFILEGLAATKRITRTDERGFQAADTATPRRGRQQQAPDHDFDDLPSMPGSKKKYYN
jgi:magnesium chelatase subunit I